ncbi:Galactose mutarotase-like [Pedococcus cremeus]|uniref:Galactose mutarotase-like n=1 Tax=Pedococcus cremeus TaxID=587636 RepID=A0A1H9TD68_9MICO|nr:TIM-barrel domain-containing protein [Pedococcus cremeus]SER94884.1 Galactose mutarotase-like [Pedococcus cremeus]
MTRTTLLGHRPHGIEHPYATSLDQRIPVMPQIGEPVLLGVQALADLESVTCEWVSAEGDATTLVLEPRVADAADAAALAGGEGHLAAAQAASLGGDGGWAVQTPPVEEAGGYSYRFHATTRDGATQTTDWYALAPGQWVGELPAGLAGTLTGADTRLVDGSVEWLVTESGVHRVRFALALREGDHVVGFGERFDHLDQSGRRLDAVVFEQYKSQGAHGRTYLPMPFAHVIGADGSTWGFHVRTTRRSWYDVGASQADRLVVEVALGGTGEESLDVALYDGHPTAVLRSFLDEVGRAEELPSWVFRLWASGNEWNTQALVTQRMDSHSELDIPVGVIVIEAWSDEEGIMLFRDATYAPRLDGSPFAASDFTFPADGAWPDPKAMVDDLHSRGIKVLLWQIPLLKTEQSEDGLHEQVLAEGEAMVREGHAVREADGTAYLNRGWWFPKSLMPDLSVQRTRDWWTAKRDYLVGDLGIDGFKTDGGEHAWGHDLQYADGSRGDEGNNLYPVHYARAFGDLLGKHGKAPVTFSRSGFTGSQAHGVFWAGDEDSTWEAFNNSVTAGLTAASCGIVYWGWDLAGFSGPVPDAELYLRAAGASVFMPVMQYHSEFNHHQLPLRDRTPWHVAEVTGDERVVPVFREFAHLRERLVDYLTEQAGETVRTDRPLMRALFFDHPGDAQVWEHPRQWMLGADLLVNPVTQEGATTWSTYLPAGEWVDVWSGESHEGGQVVERDVPINEVPVYCTSDGWSRLVRVFQP